MNYKKCNGMNRALLIQVFLRSNLTRYATSSNCYADINHLANEPRTIFSRNIYEVPRIDKVVINRGLGMRAKSAKVVEASLLELQIITGQRGTTTYSRDSIAGFKIRAKMPIGVKVTLRGNRIYAFIDRIVNLSFPRIRDFRGISLIGINASHNYHIGLEEQLLFPEISYEKLDQLRGIDISMVTSKRTNTRVKGLTLLRCLGIPFRSSGGFLPHIYHAMSRFSLD